MTKFNAKPHVSDAVRQLRRWVTLAAVVLSVCCATQMLVYGFAAYTDIRWEEVKQARTEAKPVVVVGEASKPLGSQQVVGGVRATLPERGAVEVNRVRSGSDVWMRRASDMACGAGMLAAGVLCVLSMLGLVIAGGACIPGVERVTTATVWSLVLALFCAPLARVMPGLAVPGVFAAYEEMTKAIDTHVLAGTSAGTFALGMQWFFAPLVAMFASLGVILWFRAGVERGVIITAPSELDKAVEREVGLIQKRGVSASAPKAIGALHQAIGAGASSGEDGPRGAPPGTLSAVERALEEASALAASAASDDDGGITRRRIPRTVADGDYKRPI